MTDTPEQRFQDHDREWQKAICSIEDNTHAQFKLRDEIGYADKRIGEMEADTLAVVAEEWTKQERKPNNADDRKAEASKRLKVHGPYLDAVKDRIEKNKTLMAHGATAARLNEEMRRHRANMAWLTATVQATFQ